MSSGAKVNVMNIHTMKDLYGLGGAPITVVVIVEIPLELGDRETLGANTRRGWRRTSTAIKLQIP